MPKASPLLRAFNGGVVSELIDGRTDLEKYGVFLRQCINNIPASQGPALRRSGFEFQRPVYDEALRSHFLEFVFSNDLGQSYVVEAANLRFRWHNDEGLLAYTPVTITAAADVGGFLRLTAPGHGAVVGEQVVLAGMDYTSNLNGATGNATVVAGNLVTTDIPYSAPGSLVTATLARVYHIASPYLAADVGGIRFTGDRDVLYLWCEGYPRHELKRYGAYDWRLVESEYIDGPYDVVNETATTLKPDDTGDVVIDMSSDSTSGFVSSASGGTAWHAFDRNNDTYWDSGAQQTGTLMIQLPAARAVDGYAIAVARANNDTNYKSIDYAPGTWTFDGSDDGVTWIMLDSKVAYIDYNNLRSAYFKLKNTHTYLHYRLKVTQCTRNGAINVRVAGLHMTSRDTANVTLLSGANTGINQDRGFLTTDVGRLVRLQSGDGLWRWLKITEWLTARRVNAEVMQDVLSGTAATTEWRLGLYSDTSGFPISGAFYEDRLCEGGMSSYPDWLVCSVTGKYGTIAQTDPDGTVNDDNGIVVRVNARRLGRIAWVGSDNRSLLLGTGSGEWQISSADLQAALTARTAKARRANARGSATVEPIFVDNRGLYVQRGGRTLREIFYNFDADGYKTPSMSLLASHLGVDGFEQIVFTAEPHSVAWLRTGAGDLIGFTYNRDENVLGWHQHDVGGFVESLASLPAADGRHDILWMIVRRTINGATRRYIERMAPIWDFYDTLDTAFFVDSGLRYTGAAINVVYGMRHLVGETVSILADGSPMTPQVVSTAGTVTLPNGKLATNIVLGLGYESLGEIMRIEAGAGDGTSQGKTKRSTRAVLRLWMSGGGQYGTRNAEDEYTTDNLDDIAWLSAGLVMDEPMPLFTGDTPSLSLQDGYNKSGSIVFRQPPEIPLPFNVVALMPQLHTQDR